MGACCDSTQSNELESNLNESQELQGTTTKQSATTIQKSAAQKRKKKKKKPKYDLNLKPIDVTLNPDIKFIATESSSSYGWKPRRVEQIAEMMDDEDYHYLNVKLQDDVVKYLKFDLGDIKIDTIDIGLCDIEYTSNTQSCISITVYTSNIDAVGEFRLLTTNENVERNKVETISLKAKHDRYIRIGFEASKASEFGINKFKFYGFEPKIDGLIKDNGIKIYQCSGDFDAAQTILKNDTNAFKFNEGIRSWIIFDCMRYELDEIVIAFGEQSVPGIINIKLSDVAPRYSFDDTPSAQIFELETSQSESARDWIDIELRHELELSPDILYKNGFKRYIQLGFAEYRINQLEIQKIQFCGKLSKKIAKDDEQFQIVFDGEEKEIKDDGKESKPYQPYVVQSSRPYTEMEIGNGASEWKPDGNYQWQNATDNGSFVILDPGNNDVNKILVRAKSKCIYKTLKVSTSDDSQSKDDWNELIKRNDMETKMEEGGIFDLSEYDIQKFLKIEFLDIDGDIASNFQVQEIKLYGDGKFLEKYYPKVTIDDIKNMKYNDQDLVQRYKDQITAKINSKLAKQDAYFNAMEAYLSKLTAKDLQNMKYGGKAFAWIDQMLDGQEAEFLNHSEKFISDAFESKDDNLSDKWIKSQQDKYESVAELYYATSPAMAYSADTEFEKRELLKVYEKQKEMTKEMVKEQVENKIQFAKQRRILIQEWRQARNEYIANKTDKGLKEISDGKKKILEKAQDDELKAIKKHREKWLNKLSESFVDPKAKSVFDAFTDCVENHPCQLSSEYTVAEYENAINEYGLKYAKQDVKRLFAKCADLFDKSIIEDKQLLHKFLVYQLNAGDNYNYARGKSYGTPPIEIVFDVGEVLDGKLVRIAFECKTIHTNKIIVSTADELIEEKDISDTKYNYENFKIIGKLEFDDKLKDTKSEGVTYGDTRIALNCDNQRYVRVQFTDWDDDKEFKIKIKRVKFYAINDDDTVKDAAERPGGDQLDKYKLKFLKGNSDSAYNKGIDYAKYTIYKTKEDEKRPYLIFDCETRKVDKLEIKTSSYRFDKIQISTCDDYEIGDDVDHNDKKWEKIFEDSGKDINIVYADIYKKGMKQIKIKQKNKRYLRFTFELPDTTSQIEIKYLKFYTTEDASEYKWDIDQNIKDLTYLVSIVTATRGPNGHPRAMLDEYYHDNHGLNEDNVLTTKSTSYSEYVGLVHQRNYKKITEDLIRDKVCCGVNLLRKSRGGKISNHEKHFIKFLLCFQNERNYEEMLYSAKLGIIKTTIRY